MKILCVCPFLPVPATSGGALRTLNLVKQLARTDAVDLIGLDSQAAPEQLEELKRCTRNLFIARQDKPARIVQAFQVVFRFLRGVPFYSKYVDSGDLKGQLRKISREHRYDVILFNHSHMALHLSSLDPQHGAVTVLDLHNIAYLQFQRMYEHEKEISKRIKLLMTWLPMRRWEPRMAARFDQVITVSEADRNILRARNPDLRVAVVPNGVDTSVCVPSPRGAREKNILIVGSMDYEPNLDAALYFLDKIFPLIRREEPACQLTIVGQRPPDLLSKHHGTGGVTVHGDVADVKPYYSKAMVATVAMRSGGGTRLKILEAMALGTPVVSTTLGCEGIEATHGEHLLMADSPELFAREVISLLNDAGRWNRIAAQARLLVEQRYDWAIIGASLRELLREQVSRREHVV